MNVLSWLVTYGLLLTWLSFLVPCTWFCTRTFILQEVLGKPGIWKFYLSWTRSSPHRNLDVYSKTKSHAHEYIEVKILAGPAAGFDIRLLKGQCMQLECYCRQALRRSGSGINVVRKWSCAARTSYLQKLDHITMAQKH